MGKDYVELFRNPFISALASYSVLAIVGLIYPNGWIFLFSIFLSYVFSDLILNCFIRGGKGWSKIFDKNEFACEGHAYLAFFVGIVVGTILSSWGTDLLMKYLQSQMSWVEAVLVTDIFVVAAVLGDLLWRFY
jgi:hypothetical protein